MKKIYLFIIITVILIFDTNSIFASNIDVITKIENNIYGFDYSKDSIQNRVSRLERTVYGRASNGDINKRINKLSADISADVIGLEIDPVKDTLLAEENLKEDDTVSYPIVDEIEQKIFNQTYKNRDFHTRIVTIEKKLFGKIYDVEDYPQRMDRIKAKVMPESIAKREDIPYYENDYEISSDSLSGTKQNRFKFPFGQRNYTRPYTNYGDMSRYSENIPDNQQLSDELTQMEYDVFGTEFSNESTQNRIKRLNSVNKARKSSKKYDSQKFSQHMSTAMEIGAMILMVLAMIL